MIYFREIPRANFDTKKFRHLVSSPLPVSFADKMAAIPKNGPPMEGVVRFFTEGGLKGLTTWLVVWVFFFWGGGRDLLIGGLGLESGVHPSNNPFKGILGIQTTKPNHPFTEMNSVQSDLLI